MKTKILIFSLSLIVVAAIVFVACNKNNSTTNDDSNKSSIYSGTSPILVANITAGKAVPVFDMTEYEDSLIASGLFDDIDTANIDYGVSGTQQAAFLTIIGHESGNAVAFQAELDIQGSRIYLNSDDSLQTMAKHTCTGHGCSSCAFIRSGFFRRITGCECEAEGSSGSCDHSVTSDNSWILQAISVLAALIAAAG